MGSGDDRCEECNRIRSGGGGDGVRLVRPRPRRTWTWWSSTSKSEEPPAGLGERSSADLRHTLRRLALDQAETAMVLLTDRVAAGSVSKPLPSWAGSPTLCCGSYGSSTTALPVVSGRAFLDVVPRSTPKRSAMLSIEQHESRRPGSISMEPSPAWNSMTASPAPLHRGPRLGSAADRTER